jgi:hypothetical protein
MSIFTEVSEPYKELDEAIVKHQSHDQQTHGNRGGKRKKTRKTIKEILTWRGKDGKTVSLTVYPQQRYRTRTKRSRHTNLGEGMSAVAKQEQLDEIAKQLKAKE